MKKKTLSLFSKILIVLILSLMVFSPNLLVSKGASYNYDFWKNVIPSAEGLAYRETYYADDIKTVLGTSINGLQFDTLTDMAVYEDEIFILDSMKTSKVKFQESQVKDGHSYPELFGTGISAVYIVNQDFRLVNALNEFLITDEVKTKLQDYYGYYYKNYQINADAFSTIELINFYNESVNYEYTLEKGKLSFAVTEFVHGVYDLETSSYTYDNKLYELFVGDKRIAVDDWTWVANVDENDAISYEIKFVDDFATIYNVTDNVKIKVVISEPNTVGKAPYAPYSKDLTKCAIRLNNATGITVTKDGMYIADSGNARVIRLNKNEIGEWIVDGVYLTPDDTVFYQPSSGVKIDEATEVKAFTPQKIAVDPTGRLYCISTGVYEGIMEFNTSGNFNRYLGKNEVVANPLKKVWSKIFSEAQISSLTLDLPPEFTNIAMDSKGFLYATSYSDADATTNANMVKMINTSGKDIMKRNGYVTPDGDAVYLTTSTEQGVIIGMSQLVGVTVSNNGNFTIVDELRGRLFTYDNEGNLLYITGEQPGGNSQAGNTTLSNCIIDPVAIRYFYRDSGEFDADGNPIQEEVLLVLDASSKSILLYQTTEFGEAVNTATSLYQNGIVEDTFLLDEEGNKVLDADKNPIITQYGAETYWRQVVKMNTNYELAYLGIGKALLRRGEYKEAMEYFKLAHNATYYSKAYAEYRDIILSNNFDWIMTGIILLVVLWITVSYSKNLKKKNLALAAAAAMNEEKANILKGNITGIVHDDEKEEFEDALVEEEVGEEEASKKKFKLSAILGKIKIFFYEVFKHPLHIMSHPIQGWTDFKNEKKGKMWVAWVLILLYVLMEIIAYQYEGIITNKNNPNKFNSIMILVYGVIPPIVLAAANWSVTTLLDGKGKMKEIFMMIAYSMFPLMLLGFVNIGLSNVLTLDEAQFILIIDIIAWVLTAYMAFMGLVVIHEYGMGKTLWSIILTVLATLIMCFIALLIFDLAQQMYGFVYTVYKEVVTRYF